MSNIDKQALRTAAENATPGEWCTDDYHGVIADAGLNANYYIASCSGPDNRPNKRFIAAANPTTVLALLDELEAKEEQRANWFQMAEKLGADLDAAEKRIAELEAREINLPPYSFFDFKQGSTFKSGAYCHIDSVNKELSKHGIKMIAAAGKGE